MRNFLKKRWHGIPIGIIAVFILVGVVAAAGYTFLSGTVSVEVKEACTLQTWNGDSWIDRGKDFSITLDSVYPGESYSVPMQVINDSSASLTVTGTYTLTAYPDDGWAKVTVGGGFSGGISCQEGITRDDLTLTVTGDAPPGTYTVAINFNRS